MELYNILIENGPVYAYYRSDKEKDPDAHYIIVTGVDVNNNIVYTNNPWGISGKQTFKQFQNGVAKRFWDDGCGMKLRHIALV